MSDHFSIEELCASQLATRRGLVNTPPPDVEVNLNRVCGTLEQIRELTGRPLHISSGYRSPILNRAVGGAPSSAHVTGLAADISCPGVGIRDLALLIRDSGIEFDQLIHETGWVHVGLRDGPLRRQCLTAVFGPGKTTYLAGIK